MNLSDQLEQLKKHVVADKDVTYRCKKCKDKGHLLVTRSDGMEAIQPCQCRIIQPDQKTLAWHYKTDLSEQHKNTESKHFKTSVYGNPARAKEIKGMAINFVKKYNKIKEHKSGFYMYSTSPGSGKTMLSCIVAKGLTTMHKLKSQAISSEGLIRLIKQSFNDSKYNETDLINKFSSVQVLLLDDLGRENHTSYSEEIFTSIIDARLNKDVVTLYTANMEVKDLPYHARLKDRISASSIKLQFPDVSVRSKIGAEDMRKVRDILGN